MQVAGVGCYNGNIFVGTLAYADDIVLLATMARGYGTYAWYL